MAGFFEPAYVLDSNVFIQAHREYYAFDLCPGFWNCLLHHHGAGAIVSIDRVKQELAYEGDELSDWVGNHAKLMFDTTDDLSVARAFGELMRWVQMQTQFKPEAKAEFAAAADGWVIAYARVHGAKVVTHEAYAPDVKKKVPMPNVCRAFDIEWVNTFGALRALRTVFDWQEP